VPNFTRLAASALFVTLTCMADDEKILQFPGAGKRPDAAPAKTTPSTQSPGTTSVGPDGLNDDQRKAMQIVLSGMSFVLVGIKPTTSGADFFTAISGDASELRNAQDHLVGVIERAFSRKGI
jgi:hypothetical protein